MCFLRSKFPSLQWQKKTLRATFTCSLIIIIILENLKISLRNRKMFLQSVHGWLSLLPRRFYESYFLPAPFVEGGGGGGVGKYVSPQNACMGGGGCRWLRSENLSTPNRNWYYDLVVTRLSSQCFIWWWNTASHVWYITRWSSLHLSV